MMNSLITGLNKDSLNPFCCTKLLHNLSPFDTCCEVMQQAGEA